jgi:hypothetical protein
MSPNSARQKDVGLLSRPLHAPRNTRRPAHQYAAVPRIRGMPAMPATRQWTSHMDGLALLSVQNLVRVEAACEKRREAPWRQRWPRRRRPRTSGWSHAGRPAAAAARPQHDDGCGLWPPSAPLLLAFCLGTLKLGVRFLWMSLQAKCTPSRGVSTTVEQGGMHGARTCGRQRSQDVTASLTCMRSASLGRVAHALDAAHRVDSGAYSFRIAC